MKTFEERYTAWIDGQLAGGALTAFEQELARRADAGEPSAEADKADAAPACARCCKDHLQAPALTNTEFFNHQMRERIDAEIDRAASPRAGESAGVEVPGAFRVAFRAADRSGRGVPVRGGGALLRDDAPAFGGPVGPERYQLTPVAPANPALVARTTRPRPSRRRRSRIIPARPATCRWSN